MGPIVDGGGTGGRFTDGVVFGGGIIEVPKLVGFDGPAASLFVVMVGVEVAGGADGLGGVGWVEGGGVVVVVEGGRGFPVDGPKGLASAGVSVVVGGVAAGPASCFGMTNQAPTPKKTSAAIM